MTRRLRNWSYLNVVDFLRERGFRFSDEMGGSHQGWSRDNEDGSITVVTVYFTHRSFKVKTLMGIIRQSQIPESEWITWAGS